jgi:hypothetical protein
MTKHLLASMIGDIARQELQETIFGLHIAGLEYRNRVTLAGNAAQREHARRQAEAHAAAVESILAERIRRITAYATGAGLTIDQAQETIEEALEDVRAAFEAFTATGIHDPRRRAADYGAGAFAP